MRMLEISYKESLVYHTGDITPSSVGHTSYHIFQGNLLVYYTNKKGRRVWLEVRKEAEFWIYSSESDR